MKRTGGKNMRWTDMDEKEMIKAWAEEEYLEELQESYLPQPDNGKESYWAEYDNEKNIAEYDFSSVPELMAMLKAELVEPYMEDLFRPLAVSAFKQRARESEDGKVLTETGETAGEITIPEFVYIF